MRAPGRPPRRLLLLYATVYPDHIGGIEVRNWGLAHALAAAGVEVTLAGFCAPRAAGGGVHVRSLGPPPELYNREGRRSTREALRFARAMRRLDLGGFDAVETANMPYTHLPSLARRCRRTGVPLIVTWYEYWGAYFCAYVGRAKAPFYRAFEWWCAQLGAAAQATSELTARRLARRRRGGAVDLVPCGIDGNAVREAAAAGSAEGSPLVHAGRLLEHKRIDLLLRALVPLAAARPEPRTLLTIFGEGPARPALEALARDLGVAPRVRFRGHVPTSREVWAAFGRSAVAVQPSAREGFGLFPLEAMAAGLPVVHCTSSESAVGELVRDRREGLAVAPDAAALAAALADLLADEAWRRALSENARRRAAEYEWHHIAGRFLARAAAVTPG